MSNKLPTTRFGAGAHVGVNIPAHIRETFPNFLEFMATYYTWLKGNEVGEDNPLPLSESLVAGWDAFEAPDEYLNALKNQYLANIGDPWYRHNLRLFISNAVKFYQSKGTAQSYEFLFSILYSLDSRFSKPEITLRASDGELKKSYHVRFAAPVSLNDIDMMKSSGVIRDSMRDIRIQDIKIIANQSADEISGDPTGYVYDIALELPPVISLDDGVGSLEIVYPNEDGTFFVIPIHQLWLAGDYKLNNLYVVSSIDVIHGGTGYAVGNSVLVDSPCDDSRIDNNFIPAFGIVTRAEATTGAILAIEMLDPGFGYWFPMDPAATDGTDSVDILPTCHISTTGQRETGIGTGAVLTPEFGSVFYTSILLGRTLLSDHDSLLQSDSTSNPYKAVFEFDLTDDFDERNVSGKVIRDALDPAGFEVSVFATAHDESVLVLDYVQDNDPDVMDERDATDSEIIANVTKGDSADTVDSPIVADVTSDGTNDPVATESSIVADVAADPTPDITTTEASAVGVDMSADASGTSSSLSSSANANFAHDESITATGSVVLSLDIELLNIVIT